MLWDLTWFISAVWLGYSLDRVIRAVKLRIRFHVNPGSFITEEPEVLHRMVGQLNIENARLRRQIDNKHGEIKRLRRTIQRLNNAELPRSHSEDAAEGFVPEERPPLSEQAPEDHHHRRDEPR